jgi:bis(5'-adenosyl)-triphosphatase
MVERVFKATSLNIAMQDGPDAGQSVPHVHTHIIPRKPQDLEQADQIYELLEGQEGDIGKQLEKAKKEREANGGRPKFPTPDSDENRQPRSDEDMRKEAEWLRVEMAKEEPSL